MKFIKLLICFLVLFLFVHCKNETKETNKVNSKIESQKQNLKKQINPTARQIAENFKPEKSEIVHQVIETKVWGKKNVIIVFYETKYIDSESTTTPYERQFVEGYLLIPDSKNKYQKVLIYKFEDDNVATIVNSVFFANADNDTEKELIILTTCSHRLQYLYDGIEYSTYVFDNFDMKEPPKEMTFLHDISGKLQGGFEGEREEGLSKADFKTASEVKAELKKLGY